MRLRKQAAKVTVGYLGLALEICLLGVSLWTFSGHVQLVGDPEVDQELDQELVGVIYISDLDWERLGIPQDLLEDFAGLG